MQSATAVLAFDYSGRGAAASGPPTRTVRAQLDQIHGALCLARQLPGVDPNRVGLLGSGGTGGGHVLVAAAEDSRVRAVVSQFPIVGGRAWLRSLLSATTWRELIEAVENDHRERLRGGPGTDIDLDALWRPGRARAAIPLEYVASLLSYHPIDTVHRVRAAVLVIAVEDDEITPTEHAERVFARLRGPKRLLIQRDVDHHESYERNADIIDGAIASWFQEHLVPRRTVQTDSAPRWRHG